MAFTQIIHAQAQTKTQAWFIISGDGVRPSKTKQNKPIKELNHFSS